MYLKLIPLLLLVSCTKYHELKKKSGVYYLTDVYNEIQQAKNVEWEVGRKREATISKGIRLNTSISNLSDEAKSYLYKKYGIDSWIIRLSRERRGYAQGIGYFFINLSNMSRTSKDYTINLYYHAAAVSKRFRLFHCPAFKHRYDITSFDLEDRLGVEKGDIYIRPVKRFPGKVTPLRFAPMIISGGRSLLGKYFIDMALYNTKTKLLYSEWVPVDKTLIIRQEVARSVASCLGVVEEEHPLKESSMPNIRDLEIK